MIFTKDCNYWDYETRTLKDRTERQTNHTVFLLLGICRSNRIIFCGYDRRCLT